MMARTLHVKTWATTCRCLAASERTSSSESAARASIWVMIRPRAQSASRVSSTAPSTSNMMTSRSPRAQVPKSDSGAIAVVKTSLPSGGPLHLQTHQSKEGETGSVEQARGLAAYFGDAGDCALGCLEGGVHRCGAGDRGLDGGPDGLGDLRVVDAVLGGARPGVLGFLREHGVLRTAVEVLLDYRGLCRQVIHHRSDVLHGGGLLQALDPLPGRLLLRR